VLEGKIDICAQFIFIDNREFAENSLRNREDVLFVEIDGNLCREWVGPEFYDKFGLEFHVFRRYYLMKDIENFVFPIARNIEYKYVYIYIGAVDRILEVNESYYSKIDYFFNCMFKFVNRRIFFLVDKSQKQYVLEQINAYIEHQKRLKGLNNEICGQMLFTDDIKNVKRDKDDFFAEVDGGRCQTLRDLCDEFELKLGFPNGWGRNLDAIDDLMCGFWWFRSNYAYKSLLFIHIKDIKNIILDDKEKWNRAAFFDCLGSIGSRRIFIIIDKKDKDFVLGEIENYKKIKESERAKT
jgi:hypothetical protein